MPADTAFREHVSGLLVPAALSREREVWTRDEWKTLERATKFLNSKDLRFYFGCAEPSCKGAPLERVRRPDGGITLRCAHKDRHVMPGL